MTFDKARLEEIAHDPKRSGLEMDLAKEFQAALLQISALQEECQDLRNLKEKLIKDKYTNKDLQDANRLVESLKKAVRSHHDEGNCQCEELGVAEGQQTERPKCDHKWAHIEDHHVICEKCKHVADLCWECEKERPCADHPRPSEKQDVPVTKEPRHCIKCGVEVYSTAHVYGCGGRAV